MSYLDYQYEILRGQIEEMQGRLEELLALRRGRAGVFGSLRGRSRRARGKARQSYARARYGVLGFRPQVKMPSMPSQPQPRMQPSTKYVLLAVGVTLAVTAALWPGLLSSLWNQASGLMNRTDDAWNQARTSAEL